MKKLIICMFLLMAFNSYSQNGLKVYKYGELKTDWARTKTNSGTFGLIDRQGNEVAPPIYTKIEKFKGSDDLLLVKSISDAYGLIDMKGVLVVPAIYRKIEVPSKPGNAVAVLTDMNGTIKLVNYLGGKVVIK